MQKLLLSFLVVFFVTMFHGVVLAAPTCPPPPQMIELDAQFNTLSATAKERITKCLAARRDSQESSITDFSCPSGDYNRDARPHTREILSYQIAVATVFEEIDKSAMEYAHSLQCMRERDPIKWIETNRIVIHGDGNTVLGYEQKYRDVCQIGYIEKLLTVADNSIIDAYLKTSDTYPQWFDCSSLATRKVKALDNLTALLAANGVSKGYQNDKDTFISQVKGKYKTLIEKLVDYIKLVSMAVSKLDTYLTRTIR